jgi:acetyl-CoA acetyltransferase/uncharacterized OB-fold protein
VDSIAPQPGRPLPTPTLASAPFWASGLDGVLRIAHCQHCDAYIHPPAPTCAYCESNDIAFDPVSGRATVAAFTVNQHQWLPHFDPPYTIAVVALAEDDRVRLTTNIVNAMPDSVYIGQCVRVVFENHAEREIAVPLFEPDPGFGRAPGPIPELRDYRSALRVAPRGPKFEDRVVISGVGQSEVGRRLMVDPVSLAVSAIRSAVADAGLQMSDIDGLSTYPGPMPGGMSEGGVTAVEEVLRLRPTWVNGAAETPGQIGSIITAMLAVASGLCRHVVCFRTVWEASEAALLRSGRIPAGRPLSGPIGEWRLPFGAASAANWIACNAMNYSHRYGDVRPTLGRIAVTQRAGAVVNPEAVYRTPLTLDEYFDARMISTPLGLYDCDVPVDGSVAVVVSAAETRGDLAGPPVLVEAVGTQILERLSWDQDTLTHLPQSLGPSAHLWTRTELTPEDVDVALLYDGFTFNALSWLEGLGFCELGGAREFIGDGSTIARDGLLPLNPHGGQLSAGRLHGYGFVREAVLQLRGVTGERQVDDASVAVVTAGGGVPSGALLLRRE